MRNVLSRVVKLLYQRAATRHVGCHVFSCHACQDAVLLSSMPAREALISSAIFRTPSDATTTSRPKSHVALQCVALEPLDHFEKELEVTLSHDVLAWFARASVVLPHHAEVLLLDVVAARQLWCAEHCPIHGVTLHNKFRKACVAMSTVWTVRCASGSQARVTQMHGAVSAPLPVLSEMKRHAMVEIGYLVGKRFTPKGPLGPNDHRTRNIWMDNTTRTMLCILQRACTTPCWKLPHVVTSSINPEFSNSRFSSVLTKSEVSSSRSASQHLGMRGPITCLDTRDVGTFVQVETVFGVASRTRSVSDAPRIKRRSRGQWGGAHVQCSFFTTVQWANLQ